MLNMNALFGNGIEERKDNEVIVNGMKLMVTDEVAMKVLNLCLGKEIKTASPASPVAPVKEVKETKDKKVGGITKCPAKQVGDLTVGYHVEKKTTTEGKTVYVICRGEYVLDANGNNVLTKNGRNKLRNNPQIQCAKKCVNNAIKSIKGINTYKLPFEGKSGTYDAWGYATEKTALEKIKTLPTLFAESEVNEFFKEYKSR